MYICDYNLFVDAIVDVLLYANKAEATYDLSAGLEKRVCDVVRVDLDIHPEFKANYPIVAVKLKDRREYFGELAGGNYNKDLFLDIDIECVYDALQNSEKNLWALTSNIEAILRNSEALMNYKHLGFSVLSVLPKLVMFSTKFRGQVSNFNKAAKIFVEVRGLLKSV